MSNFDNNGRAFLDWLINNGASISDSIAFKDYSSENAGRGVVATKDIKDGDVLFSIPRSLLLSQLTTSLKEVDGLLDDLNGLLGWTPLIISLMYEMKKDDSFWKPYLDVLPQAFSTPMFWTEEELKELNGTDVIPKIGRSEAEETYRDVVVPFMEKYPALFNKDIHTLELFHICGSVIMAYSFIDELQKVGKSNSKHEDGENVEKNGDEKNEVGSDDDDDEDDDEEEGLITMVPMADMLNHKTGFNNARLFHETDCLQMKAIKFIRKGEQIYNTYGDLCNADLLRKYGFTDENNPFDLVELDGPLVVKAVYPDVEDEKVKEKIDFLMEEGVLDECFVIDTEYEIPPELIVTVHVLIATPGDFKKMVEKEKLPKPKLTEEVKNIILSILRTRLERYPTDIKDDELELQGLKGESSNKRNALMVRIGEKKILFTTLKNLESAAVVNNSSDSSNKKRPASKHENSDSKTKKQRK
ncbi:hypothetical protein BDF20DRAFT_872393 [Mycotypha africana]|uniref:uncharacterized protein n=1 Tax=Mycotypha africana TaxID=64632 RepID=UPI002301E816|nr:uncharacterized protein BDF20DRAFT_872393 [Mycotypha africana]KAI8977011.1 hypothetical protein BDF20DRAFT_872393 [Mycotypha africana]